MWISRGDDFLNLTNAEYDELVKTAWNGLDSDEKSEYKNNFMMFKKDFEENDEDYFFLSDMLLEKFNEMKKKYSGKEVKKETIHEICDSESIKLLKIEEPNIYSVYLDDEMLDDEAREQLNWEYSFDLDLI
ncbi:MAG: hypothetical protein RR191_00055 [Cetobacterium sp.]|uniref:hypothetical protein n=1 Tax=unclassified Cetobacterium TaxID=2630983 RepID=UPI00163B82E3|nr:hypothetical protein [Cetobacterium sp. 2A]MBC2856685.1 hypothetical protein [Cetobacterium sp. 2A]